MKVKITMIMDIEQTIELFMKMGYTREESIELTKDRIKYTLNNVISIEDEA